MAMTYQKTSGAANIKGPMYENKMAALLFVRGINSGLDFQLGSNVANAEALDDIVFRFKPADNEAWSTIFVQLKHKMKPFWLNQVILTDEKSELGVIKYFKSYAKIKECMSRIDKPTLFDGSIDDCTFIMFTNAKAKTELGGRSVVEGKAEEFVWSGTGTVVHFDPEGERSLDTAMAVAFQSFGDAGKDYLRQVRIFADQPNEGDMEKLIKNELGKTECILNDRNIDIDLLYRCFIDNVTEWCEKSNKILLKESDLLSRAWKKMKVSAEDYKAREDFLLPASFNETAINLLRMCMKCGDADNSVFVVKSSEATSRLSCTKLVQAIGTSRFLIGIDALMINKQDVISECQKERKQWLVVSTQDYDPKSGAKMCAYLKELLCLLTPAKIRLAVVSSNNALLEALVSEFQEHIIYDDSFKFSQLEEKSRELVLSRQISFQGKLTTLFELFEVHLDSVDHFINSSSVIEILVSDRDLIVGPNLADGISYYVPRTLHRAAIVNDTIYSVSTLAESIIVLYSSSRDLQSILMKADLTLLPSSVEAALDSFSSASPESGVKDDPVWVGETWQIGALECNFSRFRNSEGMNVPVMRFRPKNDKQNLPSEWFVMVREGPYEEDTIRASPHFYHAKHFLRYRDGKTVWIESTGQINCIRPHVAENQLIALDVLDLKFNLGERLVLLCAEPGMGKTTLTVHLAKRLKDKFPLKFVIRISLSDNDIPNLFAVGKHSDAFGFLSDATNIKSEVEKTLLKFALHKSGNVVVLVDGFDEISPKYLEECLILLSNLQQTKAEKLFLTSRNSIKIRLEDHSSTLAANLQKFNDGDKRLFLKQFWKDKSKLLEEEMDKFIDQLLKKMSQAISDRERDILGIPLQLQITATVLESHITGSAVASSLPEKLDLLYLMEKFVESKIRIFVEEKLSITHSDRNYDYQLETHTSKCKKFHTRAALLLIVNEEDIKELLSENEIKKTEKFLEDIGSCKDKSGIIDYVVNKKAHFVHRVFAEFFVAVWFAKHFKKISRSFLQERLYKTDYNVVRVIFDRLLARENKLHTLVLNKNLNGVRAYLQANGDVNSKDVGGRTALHLAAAFSPKKDMAESAIRSQILDLLIERTTDFNQLDEVHNVPPLKYADLTQSWIALDRLLPLSIAGEKYLTTTQANVADKELLKFMCTHNLDKLGKFCKEKGLTLDLTDRYTTDLRSTLLKFNSRNVINVLSELVPDPEYSLLDASFKNNLEEVKRLIQVEVDARPENKLIYINQKDSKGATALHYAAGFGQALVVKYLLTNGADPMILENSFGATPLHAAMVLGQMDAVSLILNAVPESERFDFITKGSAEHNFNTFHIAVGLGHVSAVRSLLDIVYAIGGVEYKVALVRSRTGLNRTAFGLAAECKHMKIFDMLIEDLNKGEVTAIINNQDDDGDTPLHNAAFGGDVAMVRRVLELGGNIDVVNKMNQTPAMLAAEAGHQAVVDFLNEKLDTFDMD